MPSPVNLIAARRVDRAAADHAQQRVDGPLARWLGRLWPASCQACGEAGQPGLDLCPACDACLPRNRHACRCCALPLPLPATAPANAGMVEGRASAATPVICGACLLHPPPLHTVVAPYLYAAPLDRLLPRFKFHQDLGCGRLLAQLMARELACAPTSIAAMPQIVVPIPLHRARLRARGYDQALELARPLARALSVPLASNLLVRERATRQQSRLDADQRKRNLRNAFRVVSTASLPVDGVPAHVVLVDDVMTTGATVHAAAMALQRAGVARVDAWVCARVP